MQVPLFALGICDPNDVGGVKATPTVPLAVKLVPLAIPDVCPESEPKAYVNLCLKLESAGAKLIVTELPIVTEVAETVGVVALGIVGKSQEPLPVEL